MIKNPAKNFTITTTENNETIIMPVDGILDANSESAKQQFVNVSSKYTHDESNLKPIKVEAKNQQDQAAATRLYRGWQIQLPKAGTYTFSLLRPEAESSSLQTDKRPATKNFAELVRAKYAFAVLLLALTASLVSFYLGMAPINIFCAVLMCICPCMIVLAESGLNAAGKIYLQHKKIIYGGENLLQDFGRLSKAKIASDLTGTLTKIILDNDTRQVKSGLKEFLLKVIKQFGKLTILTGAPSEKCESFNKSVKEFLPDNAEQSNIEIHYGQTPADKANFFGNNSDFLYLGNGPNDVPSFQKKNVISFAVSDSNTGLVHAANFYSQEQDEATELENISNLPKLARKFIILRNVLYALAITYSLTIIPLIFCNIVSPMWACISMSLIGLGMIAATKLIIFWDNRRQKNKTTSQDDVSQDDVSQDDAKAAFNKMQAINNKLGFKSYSTQELNSQAQHAGVIKSNKHAKTYFAIILQAVALGLSFLKISKLQQFMHYLSMPLVVLTLMMVFNSAISVPKMFGFSAVTASILFCGYVLPKLQPKFKLVGIIIAICLAIIALGIFYQAPLNMYEIQISAIFLLGLANQFDLAHTHNHHLFIMGLVLLVTSIIKIITAPKTTLPVFKADDIAEPESFAVSAPSKITSDVLKSGESAEDHSSKQQNDVNGCPKATQATGQKLSCCCGSTAT